MLKAFVAGLREFGYVDGKNIIVERKLSEANTDRLREAVAELLKHDVDVIVAVSTWPLARVRARVLSVNGSVSTGSAGAANQLTSASHQKRPKGWSILAPELRQYITGLPANCTGPTNASR